MNVRQFLAKAEKFAEKRIPVFDGDGTPLKAIHLAPVNSEIGLYFTDNNLLPTQAENGFIACQTLAEVIACLNKLVADPGKLETQSSYPLLFWDVVKFHRFGAIEDIEFVFDSEDGSYFDVY